MNTIPAQRILEKLDGYLGRNDYAAAEKHLLYWLEEAKAAHDKRNMLLLYNELAGLYRKLQQEEKALETAECLLSLIKEMNMEDNTGAGTTYINCATVYKAFGKADKAIPLFRRAEKIYNASLSPSDRRFGGLYNNMALALTDTESYEEAYIYYNKAIDIMKNTENGELEVAVSLLNIACAKETELGALESEETVKECLEKATAILDTYEPRDGYYAFVCEKCASVFGYFGYFLYEQELKKRVKEIYERS